MEVPQYTLRPNTNAMVAPWILKLLGLSILFYAGIYFNIKFVPGLPKQIPPIINILIFVFLGIMIVTQIFLYRVKFGKYKYQFYTNRIEYDGKKTEIFTFDDFQQATIKQGMFEKMFDTGEIRLNKSFVIGPISNVSQINNYLTQLVNYHISTQQRYRAQQQQAQMQRDMGQVSQVAQGSQVTRGSQASQLSAQQSQQIGGYRGIER